MSQRETALTFDCQGDALVGVLHRPERPERPAKRGVVVVVGGPQTRVGAHRQTVLLARALAAHGIAVLRFDYRGMGDSAGTFRGFEDIGPDIRAAVEAFRQQVPEVEEVVLWGLCDGAAAIAFHAVDPAPGVAGAVLLNPWVRTEDGLAASRARHYYLQRLADPAFWRKLAGGGIHWRSAAAGAWTSLRALASARRKAPATTAPAPDAPLPERVAHGLTTSRLPVLLILSGDDLTAREFEETVLATPAGRAWTARPEVTLRRLEAANHTYSRRSWRARVHAWALDWLGASAAPTPSPSLAEGP